MKVIVEFGSHSNWPTPDAVWVVDTPRNRAWFEANAELIDINSAVFREVKEPLSIIRNVLEHHPGWTEIEVHGAALTQEIERGVEPAAVAESLSDESFRLRRPE